VVTTSSAAGDLDDDARRAFASVLLRHSRGRRLAWLSMELPGVVGPVAVPPTSGPTTTRACVLGLVTFDTGTPVGRALGRCHAHGAWLEWTASYPVSDFSAS
jgi:hypothetical protein